VKVTEIARENPLASWILRVLRDPSTPTPQFREWMRRAGTLLAAYAAQDLDWRPATITTQLGAPAEELEPEEPPLLVAVLGASLHLLQGFEHALPHAQIGLIAARRIEEGPETRTIVYYERLPEKPPKTTVILDPMLATGKTIEAAAKRVLQRGPTRIIVASVIASHPGITYLKATTPVHALYTLRIDPSLDKNNFIVPGLGDAGDRTLAPV